MRLGMHLIRGGILFVMLCMHPGLSAADTRPVDRYAIRARIDTDQKRVHASQEVHFTNRSDQLVTEVYFHIYPNRRYTQKEINLYMRYASYFKVNPFPDGFQSPDFNLKHVTVDDEPLTNEIVGEDETLLRVQLDEPLPSGAMLVLTIEFEMTIPHAYGRLGWHEEVTTLSRWYPILSVQTKEGWANYPFYPFHRPFYSEAADYELVLTVPADEVVIHSGSLQEETASVDEGWKELHFASDAPLREFTLTMSPDYKIYSDTWEGVEIRSYYLGQHEHRARLAWESARGMMEYFAEVFGPYPCSQFSIAPVYLGYGGEQMGNMAFIDTRVYDLPDLLDRYVDFLVAHETAHQWLFNLIGVDEYHELWLEEGLTSYFMLGYLSKRYGDPAEVLAYPQWFKPYQWLLPSVTFEQIRDVRYKAIARVGLDRAVLGELSGFSEPSSIFSLAYGKGSRVMDMLRKRIGDDAFDQIFRRVYEEYRFRNFSVDALRQISEEVSGQDLESFFQTWLYEKGVYDAAIEHAGNGQLRLKQKGQHHLPTEIMVEYVDGSQERVTWQPGEGETVSLSGQGPIRRVKVDPDRNHLDIDRTNNTWPRRVVPHVVPIYLPLYDFAGVLPDDHYNLVYGPELAGNGIGIKAAFIKPYDYIVYAASNYEIGENSLHSRVGFERKNLFDSQTAFGAQLRETVDYEDGNDDLVSGKIYLRRELWPVSYGFFDGNDHVSLYLVRNQEMKQSLLYGGDEPTDGISYRKHDEAIVGLALHRDQAWPYPNPRQGLKLNAALEQAGHFLGAEEYFYRAMTDVSLVQPLFDEGVIALRGKLGLGYPTDKNLFELGGPDGLRGYDRKEVRGANTILGAVEYRHLVIDGLRTPVLGRWLMLERVDAVAFYEVGQSWSDDFYGADFKQDIGGGLRMTLSIASFLEKVVARLDVAQPLNDDAADDPRVWLGFGHAF